jgi:hypothetical protein
MPVPNLVTVTAKDRAGKPIPKLVVLLEIVVPRKNNYDCEPKLTDQSGTVAYTRDDMELAVYTLQHAFLMDYAGDLDDALALKAVSLDGKGIRGLLRARKLFGPAFPELRMTPERARAIRHSANRRYRQAVARVESSRFEQLLEMQLNVPRRRLV